MKQLLFVLGVTAVLSMPLNSPAAERRIFVKNATDQQLTIEFLSAHVTETIGAHKLKSFELPRRKGGDRFVVTEGLCIGMRSRSVEIGSGLDFGMHKGQCSLTLR